MPRLCDQEVTMPEKESNEIVVQSSVSKCQLLRGGDYTLPKTRAVTGCSHFSSLVHNAFPSQQLLK